MVYKNLLLRIFLEGYIMYKKFLTFIFTLILSTICSFCMASDDFITYKTNLKSNIEKNWNVTVYSTVPAEVFFKINKDGSIENIKLYKSSNNKKFDETALLAIKTLNMAGMLPSYYNSEYIEVIASFINVKNTKNVYMKKNVRIKKVIFLNNYLGDSNFKEKMIKLEPNLKIQKAIKK